MDEDHREWCDALGVRGGLARLWERVDDADGDDDEAGIFHATFFLIGMWHVVIIMLLLPVMLLIQW